MIQYYKSLANSHCDCLLSDLFSTGTNYSLSPFHPISRQFQFKPKGISMTNFKDNEVEFMKEHGNEVCVIVVCCCFASRLILMHNL